MKKAAPPVPVEVVKEEEEKPQVPQEGNSKFEYIDGTSYEGDWKIFNGIKMKHGKGYIIHGNSTADTHGNEIYEGQWEQDLMHGQGTYKFTSGAIYRGSWVKGKRHGDGSIQYLDGSSYEGEWEQDMMHGNGQYIDSDGIVWKGIFINNTYESRIQKKLQTERKVMLRIQEYQESAFTFFKKFSDAFAVSDKKTMKENLSPFFIRPEELSNYASEGKVHRNLYV